MAVMLSMAAVVFDKKISIVALYSLDNKNIASLKGSNPIYLYYSFVEGLLKFSYLNMSILPKRSKNI